MKTIIKWTLIIAVVGLIILLVLLPLILSILLPSDDGPQATAHGGAITFIPTVKQQQEFLQSEGLDLGPKGVDGKLGDPGSFTQKALRTYYRNKRADELYVPIEE